ncbi:Peptidase M23 [Actinobacteria bacterium OK074]|nr:Peptidase M23 [Actinobacteria bacterium OK074]
MPAKGKHRRPKPRRLSRSIAVAGTGGAALALPLMGAAGAHAATAAASAQSATSVSGKVSGKAESVKATQETKSGNTAKAKVTTYSVQAGDWLAKIAREQEVGGGWQELYRDNRTVIGADPSLIHPGLKLTIGAKATTESSNSPTKTKSSATKGSGTKANSSGTQATDAKDTAATSGSTSSSGSAGSSSSSSGYVRPVTGGYIGTGYKVSGGMWSSGYHTGVDFVVPTGTGVRAVAAGTVVSAGWDGSYGYDVVIRHADGMYTQYAHLSDISVSAGQSVSEGQQIGLSGATGNVTGPHLHFEVRTTPYYGSDVDPVAYLRKHGVNVG